MAGTHKHMSAINETRVGLAAGLTGTFMLAEIIGGLVSGSLALLADAGHMLTDFVSLTLAWVAFRLARRPADSRRTYGFDRFQILAAFANGLALFAIAGWIVWEALSRLIAPGEVLGGVMLVIGVAGLVVNIAAYVTLRGADRENLNVRAAAVHVIGDLLGSLAVIAASLVIMTTGWTPIDPLLSLLVAAIILRSALRVVIDSGHILLEGVPHGVDAEEIGPDLTEHVPAVRRVHHVHVWSISQERPMVTLHAVVGAGTQAPPAVAAIRERLKQRFGLDHATIEIEFEDAGEAAPAAGGTGEPS